MCSTSIVQFSDIHVLLFIAAFWRWNQKWLHVKKPGFAPFGQMIMGMCVVWYMGLYPFLSKYKYMYMNVLLFVLSVKCKLSPDEL